MHRSARNVDQRGLGKQLKRILPTPVFRLATRLFNAGMGLVPYALKYPLGTALRRGKFPYSVIHEGDVVVQVGAPRDTLRAGRSRAIHFARLVGSGTVLVVEPDADNVAALTRYIDAHGLHDQVILVAVGAWNSNGELKFLSSPDHPAANVLVGVQALDEETISARSYREVVIPVTTLDHLLAEHGLAVPKLVSITTNGAEIQILQGMESYLKGGCRFLSLASTGPGYQEYVRGLGFEYVGRDDRGYFFRRAESMPESRAYDGPTSG
jgi:FkbM family methyltransferase